MFFLDNRSSATRFLMGRTNYISPELENSVIVVLKNTILNRVNTTLSVMREWPEIDFVCDNFLNDVLHMEINHQWTDIAKYSKLVAGLT